MKPLRCLVLASLIAVLCPLHADAEVRLTHDIIPAVGVDATAGSLHLWGSFGDYALGTYGADPFVIIQGVW